MHTVISAFFPGMDTLLQSNDTSTITGCFQEFNSEGDEYLATNRKRTQSRQVFFFFDRSAIQDIQAQKTALGILFGRGLDAQCQKVLARVIKELCDGNQVTLNICGHGRGGLAALMLAKQLSHIDGLGLSVNLALLDPASDNGIKTTYLDLFEISLTNKLKNVTACKPLKKVLSLYSAYNLPTHVPLFPSYPKTTEVIEEVLPISHDSAHLDEGVDKLGRCD